MSKVYDYYLEMEELALEEGWTQMNMLTDEDIENMEEEYEKNENN